MSDAVLRGIDLVKDYRSGSTVRRALSGVSLDIDAGRFVSIMGPSGSGKSTLLHVLAGLDTPTAGEVWFEGKKLSDLAERDRTAIRRRRIGFVFQQFNLVPVLTAEENVGLPLVIDRVAPKDRVARVDRVLEIVGLVDRRRELPASLSGGEQQRIAIARALVTDPAVILADEPTGNLDSATGAELLGLIRATQLETGQTIVLVTHDARAAAVGDEVVRIHDGVITERHSLARDRRGRLRRDARELLEEPCEV